MSSGVIESFDLAGRTVVVTGAAGLLGTEYCRALVEAGACVVLADVAPEVEAVAAALRAVGGRTLAVVTDVTSEESVDALVESAMTTFGRIDGLVNNAALDPKADVGATTGMQVPFERYPLDAWNRTLAVNLTGMFLCARAVARVMRVQREGAIVNVSSTYGLVGPDQRLYAPGAADDPELFKPVDYSVTKSAVLGLTRYLAAYFAGTGIRVNTLTPGGVRNRQPQAFVDRYAARTPLGRMADRREYCGAMIFLLSSASSYMTGSNLIVDGGWTAW